MWATARIALIVLLVLPTTAFAQLGSPRDGTSRGAERAGPMAGVRRDAYVKAEQAQAGERAGKRFDQIDGGHEGVIDRAAYIKYYEARSKRLAEGRFDRMDTDHNGVLEMSEIAAWRAAHQRASRARHADAATH
jgi:hypothetical protein